MANYSFPALQMVPAVGDTIVIAGGCGGIGRSLVAAANEIGLNVFVRFVDIVWSKTRLSL